MANEPPNIQPDPIPLVFLRLKEIILGLSNLTELSYVNLQFYSGAKL